MLVFTKAEDKVILSTGKQRPVEVDRWQKASQQLGGSKTPEQCEMRFQQFMDLIKAKKQ
jgi:hypothetical protein